MNAREYIIKVTKNAIKSLKFEGEFKIQILKPKESNYGDYAINIAMELAKIEHKNPLEIAESIKEELAKDDELFEYFDLVEVVKPGFINFHLAKRYLQKSVKEVVKKGDKFGNLDIGKNKKVQVEFISANPTGPLTVGNGRGGPFGDVLANVYKKAGYKTEKAYYVNDYGNQILSLGHSVLKDDQAKYAGEYIDELSKQLGKEKDPYKVGKMAAKIILEKILKKTMERLNISFDEWFSETTLHDKGEVDKVIQFLKKKDLVYEKDSAQWFKSSQFGDARDRVIVKSDGKPTYLAGDIAYHKYKFEKKKFDKAINIWGADHFGDVAGLMAGVEAIGHKGQLEIVLLQLVSVIKDGKPVKMSKRLGTAIAMDDLLDEVPADVIRFFFLQKSNNTHLNFDMNLAKEQSEKNPVFYVQYAYARICSILRNAGVKKQNDVKSADLLTHDKELNLIKQISYLPEIIEDISIDHQVHHLTQYAIDLATSFHQFYNECHVLTDDQKLKEARLSLISATKIALKAVLDILGVSAPDKM